MSAPDCDDMRRWEQVAHEERTGVAGEILAEMLVSALGHMASHTMSNLVDAMNARGIGPAELKEIRLVLALTVNGEHVSDVESFSRFETMS